MSVVARVAVIAERQYALASLAQLRQVGVTAEALRSAVRTGEIERALPSVYAIGGVPWTWRRHLRAALLDAGAGAAASHRAAAKLLGQAHRDAPELVELTVREPNFARIPGAIVHRSRDLLAEHVIEVDGIPCTGPLRTLVDLGAVERWTAVSDALERSLQSGLVTLRGAEWMLTELSQRGRTGCGVFRRVLDQRALTAASPDEGLLEPRMARLLRDAGLPFPEYQYVVRDGGRFVARVDFAYPELREAFEVDGFEKHGTPGAMEAGFERSHRLKAAGWGVTPFNWKQVVRKPDYVESVVRSVLRAHGVV